MSNDAAPEHVAEWIAALFAALDHAEPRSGDRVRRLADGRAAFIGLDRDVAHVAFSGADLVSRPVRAAGLPCGTTDSETVTDILGGYTETGQAIADGRIEISGRVADVMAIAAIIEVLVDASTRIPALQELSADFLAGRRAPASGGPARYRARLIRQEALRQRERGFLVRHGLANTASRAR